MNELTHKFVTKAAFGLADSNIEETAKDIVIRSSVLPDVDEKDHAYAWHFYNPATGLNFRDERISALSKFVEHWRKAKSNNNEAKAFEELGRAVHFLEDLCTPVHTFYEDYFDAVTRLEQHVHFEKVCDDLLNNIAMPFKLNDKGSYTHNSLETIGKSCAMKASVLFSQMDDKKMSAAQAGKKAISNGIQAVAGVLYRFNREVTVWNE